MTAKNDGGPAFPCEVGPASDGHTIQTGNMQWMQPGMTMRDYFAAHAIEVGRTCMTTADSLDYDARKANIARHAYEVADAMLKEREK